MAYMRVIISFFEEGVEGERQRIRGEGRSRPALAFDSCECLISSSEPIQLRRVLTSFERLAKALGSFSQARGRTDARGQAPPHSRMGSSLSTTRSLLPTRLTLPDNDNAASFSTVDSRFPEELPPCSPPRAFPLPSFWTRHFDSPH